MKWAWAARLAAFVVLVGCLSAAQDDRATSEPLPLPDPAAVDLDVALFGVPWRISTLVWAVPGATTAVILVHGNSGVKENYFHTAPERGASLGARIAGTGRTAIGVDLPGYGESDGDPNVVTFDLMAEAVREVARLARAGEQGLAAHDAVAAYGLSMGALIVNLAASGSDALDAIIPAGGPLSAPTDEGRACAADPACVDGLALYNGEFFIPNIDWDVANATIAGYEAGQHDANRPGYAAWAGPCSVLELPDEACGTRRADAAAADVRAAVFTWVGDHEVWFLGTDLAEEPSYYPNAARVDVWVVPDAGHFVHNHRTQPDMVERMDSWLDEIGA